MFIDPQKAKLIEDSIAFLVNEYSKTGRNPKPVIFHSINVAFYLLRSDYDENLAIAAVLHDLLEDSGVTFRMIEEKFGTQTAELVSAVTYNSKIKGRVEQYKDMFKRTITFGKEAVILKCADLYDNSFYIRLVKDDDSRNALMEKVRYFLELSKPLIGNETVWRDLNDQYCLIAEQYSLLAHPVN